MNIMKKLSIIEVGILTLLTAGCALATLSAAVTASVFSSPKEVVVDDPSSMANIEALTNTEIYIKYDKYCTDKGDGSLPLSFNMAT